MEPLRDVWTPLLLMERWTKRVLEKVRAGVTQDKLVFEIVGYRLDDFVLVALPHIIVNTSGLAAPGQEE